MGMALAVKNVQNELSSMEGAAAATGGNRAQLLRERWERQRMAAELFTAAFADDDGKEKKEELPDNSPKVPPPSMDKFIVICCLMKLVITPGICIALNHALFGVGIIPNNKMMRLILDIYPCIPTAAALVARFSAGGFDDAARYCATAMLPMYLLSIPSMAGYIVVSCLLIGD